MHPIDCALDASKNTESRATLPRKAKKATATSSFEVQDLTPSVTLQSKKKLISKKEINIPKKESAIKKQNVPCQKEDGAESAVIYVGRIPHGFYETQMREYFSQFGQVVNLRLSRNRQTARSKHYAFIEFATPHIAATVAAAMHNYLLCGALLQVHVVPRSRIHADLWRGANKTFRHIPRAVIQRAKHNRAAVATAQSPAASAKKAEAVRRKFAAKNALLQAAGIDYAYTPLPLE